MVAYVDHTTALNPGTAGTTSGSFTVGSLPTHAAGDRMLLYVSGKPDNAAIPTINQGWTLVGSGTGGTGATGLDVGPSYWALFAKDATSSSETPPSVTFGSPSINSSIWDVIVYRPGTGATWADSITTSAAWVKSTSDTTASASPLTGTTAAFPNAPTAGDAIVVFGTSPTDSTIWTSTTITATGLSGGTISGHQGHSVLGNDMSDFKSDWIDFTGTASSGMTITFNFSAGSNTSGPIVAVHMRQTAAFTGTLDVAPVATIASTGSGTGNSAVAPSAAIATAGGTSGTSARTVAVAIATTGTLLLTGTSSVDPSVDIATTGALGVPGVVEVDTVATITTTGNATGTTALAPTVAIATTGTLTGTAAVAPVISLATTGTARGTSAVTVAATISTTGLLILTGTSTRAVTVAIATTGAIDTTLHTQTDNRAGGRVRSGIGITSFDPPLEDYPATVVAGVSYPMAQAISATSIVGNQAHFTVASARGAQTRLQILYGNRDITFLRDIPTPRPSWQRATPFDFGPSTLVLPQFANPHERAGTGFWSWLRPGKNVRYRIIDVATGDVLKTIYRGVHTGYDPDSATLTLQIVGQATGRMALRDQQAPLFTSKTDVLNLMRRVFQSIGLPFNDDRADTGIELGRFGDTGMLDYAQQILSRTQNRSGNQFTVMPDSDGVYQLFRRNSDTIHGTIYLDDARVSASLHRDLAEEPNRIFGRGTTPEGKRIMNGVYPGLVNIDPVPPYPMDDDSLFSLGTLSSETDHGFLGMLSRLQTLGYLNRDDADAADGEYTQDIANAVSEVQEEAQLEFTDGIMDPDTWDALFNVSATGYSVWWSKIEPMASLRPTRRVKRTPDGAIIGKNPTYDPQLLLRDRTLDFGAGFEVRQMHEFARAELDSANDLNWAGTITLGLGAIVRGNHTPGTPIDADDVMADWELDPGENYKVVNTAGGQIVAHCSGITYSDAPTQLTVDTRFRDAQPVWEVIRRNKESRGDLNRKADRQRRASTEVKDILTPTEEYGGRIEAVPIPGGVWAKAFPVVMGKAGQIGETRIRTRGAVGDAETDVAQPTRFVLAISRLEIPPSFLNANVPDPLNDKSPWYDEDFRNRLKDEFGVWYVIGEPGALGGYSPKVQTMDGATITGLWHDESPWSFETGVQPIGHVSMFAEDATIVAGGRILWNQEIVGS